MSIEDAVSSENSFDIGSAIVNKSTITISNIYDGFSEYDFTEARVVLYVGLKLSDNTIERIRKGTYTVDEAKYNGSVITLSCLDNMRRFDRKYSESKLKYPATLNQIVRDACTVCGVTLQTYQFPHDDFIIQERPSDEAITFREIISWAAQISCCFCRCDIYGRLELKWYDQETLEKEWLDGGKFDTKNPNIYTTGDNADGGSFNPWNTGYEFSGGSFEELEDFHHIYSNYSMGISTDDVVITGVRVLEKSKEDDKEIITTYQSGTNGYVISIENNELIKGGAGQTVVEWIGVQLIGFRFRKFNVTHSSDPRIEGGDVGFLTDRKQNTYPIVISSTNFSTGEAQITSCGAEDPVRNSAERFSVQTKNYIDYRRGIEKERTEREKAQEDLKRRIDESPGLFTTEITQPNGSTIFYMHDKPKLNESKIVWKMTAEAWGVSTDGGETYNAGMTVDGDTIVRILTAVGVNADWIKTGAFKIEKNGKVLFNADTATGNVDIIAKTFSLTSGETIDSIAQKKANTAQQNAQTYADTAAQNAVNNQTQTSVFNKLTNNGVSQGIYLSGGQVYMNASYIQTGYFSADRMQGGTLTLGGANNGNGRLIIKNNEGAQVGYIDNTGVNFNKGTFSGSLNAATGSFSGSLSAATGTFKGELSAATGSFFGTITSDNNLYYTSISNGMLWGGAHGQELSGYVSFNVTYAGTGVYGTKIGGKGIMALCTQYLGVGEWSTPYAATTVNLGQDGTLQVITNIQDNGDGTITWTYGYVTFRKGLMVTTL